MAAFRAIIFILLLPLGCLAQTDRYMIFFKDKNQSPFSISQPKDFLSARSIARRTRQSVVTLPEDLPVNNTYITQTRAAGAHVYYSSRWRNGVLAEIHEDTVDAIKNLPFVSTVEYVAPGSKLQGGRIRRVHKKFAEASMDASSSQPQLKQLEVDEMHAQGFHGEGILIAVMDGGFASANTATPFEALFQRDGVKLAYNFVLHSSEVYNACDGCDHGTEVLSTIAVNTPDFTGAAWGAEFCLFVTEDGSSEYRIEEYNWLFAAEKADSLGVDVISTSLGYNVFDDPSMDYQYSDMDGKTTTIARAAAVALTKGMVVVVAAGNEGNNDWHFITTPADTPGALAIGAVNNSGGLAAFSSVGPSAAGLIKPDVVAQGVFASVVLPNGMVGTNSGTSFACPLIAGFAAGVWQAYPYLSASQLYDVVIHSGDRASSPDNMFGHGVPHFTRIAAYVEGKNTVSVYPNPYDDAAVSAPSAVNLVNITLTFGAGDTMITMYDLLGHILTSQTVTLTSNDSIVPLDISGISPGVYLIKVKNNLSNKIFRFVKH